MSRRIRWITCLRRQVHFDDSKPIPGNLFPLDMYHPIVWPLAHSSHMIEVRFQIQSHAAPGAPHGGHGHRRFSTKRHFLPPQFHQTLSSDMQDRVWRRGDDGHHEPAGHDNQSSHDEEHEEQTVLQIYLMHLSQEDASWKDSAATFADFMQYVKEGTEPVLVGNYSILDDEQRLLLELEIAEDPHDQYFIAFSQQEEPMAVAIAMHSLGSTGPIQVGIAGVIMTIVFGLIMTEVCLPRRVLLLRRTCSMCYVACA